MRLRNRTLFKRIFFKLYFILFLLIFLYGCSNNTNTNIQDNTNLNENNQNPNNWKEYELIDINTNKKFKISDFNGKKVLLESFAVWCPTCTQQQKEIKKLHEKIKNKNIISISLDTDPNEDRAKLELHTKENVFTWRYSISPIEMTQALIDEFGVKFVNAPSSPILLICENQSTRFLKSGLKTSDELISEINKAC